MTVYEIFAHITFKNKNYKIIDLFKKYISGIRRENQFVCDFITFFKTGTFCSAVY